MEGFINFTDVQVQSSILCNIFGVGFLCGAFVCDGMFYTVKFLIKKIRANRSHE